MPVLYELDRARGWIRTRCVGEVTVAEVVAHFSTLAQDPACPSRLDVLLDLSQAVTVPRLRQLEEVVQAMNRVRDRIRFEVCAIVATSDVLYGMLRRFEVLAERHFRVTRVFRDLGEAETWLLAQLAPAL